MKKIYKYATGESPPKGAVYLNTVTQTKIAPDPTYESNEWVDCWLVWHYFLVEVKE